MTSTGGLERREAGAGSPGGAEAPVGSSRANSEPDLGEGAGRPRQVQVEQVRQGPRGQGLELVLGLVLRVAVEGAHAGRRRSAPGRRCPGSRRGPRSPRRRRPLRSRRPASGRRDRPRDRPGARALTTSRVSSSATCRPQRSVNCVVHGIQRLVVLGDRRGDDPVEVVVERLGRARRSPSSDRLEHRGVLERLRAAVDGPDLEVRGGRDDVLGEQREVAGAADGAGDQDRARARVGGAELRDVDLVVLGGAGRVGARDVSRSPASPAMRGGGPGAQTHATAIAPSVMPSLVLIPRFPVHGRRRA